MRTGRMIDWIVAGLSAAAVAPLAHGQAAHASALGAQVLVSSAMQVQGSAPPAGELLREIDDPHNGDRWLLMRDDKHPGGPGLMVLAATARMGPGDPGNPSSSIQAGPEVSTPAPIIRVGDRVIVEENTAIVEARLEAVAMGPALAGVPFNVRLSIGGRVVRAVATTPGRAVFEERTEGLR